MRKRKKAAIIPVIADEKIEEVGMITRTSVVRTVIVPFAYGFIAALVVFMAISKLFLYIRNRPNVKKTSSFKARILPRKQLKEDLEAALGVYMGPMELIKMIDERGPSLVILDTRDESDYKRGHVKSAVLELGETKNKLVVVYGQSAFDTVPKQTVISLLEKGINAKVLSIGWNEFRHFRNLWVPDSMWGKFDPGKYIQD